MSIEDFTGGEVTPQLESMLPEDDGIYREPSANDRNMAAQEALLSEGGPEAYQRIMSELQFGKSDTSEKAQAARNEVRLGDYSTTLASVLREGNLDNEQFLFAVERAKQEEDALTSLYAKNLSEKPSMTDEEEEVSMSWAELMGEAVERKNLMQTLVNGVISDKDMTGVKGWASVFAAFSPFVDSLTTDNILENMAESGLASDKDASRLALFTGGNRKAMIETVNSWTNEELSENMGALKDAINNSGVVFGQGNVASIVDNLRNIEEGNYSDTEEVVDNIFGFLDIGFSAPLTSVKLLSKGGRAAVRADVSGMMKRAKEIVIKDAPQPNSPIKAAEATNGEAHANQVLAAAMDETGEVAEALSGTSKEGLLGELHLPDSLSVDASMSKVNDRALKLLDEVEKVKSKTISSMQPEEIQVAVDRVSDKLARGVSNRFVIRKGATQIGKRRKGFKQKSKDGVVVSKNLSDESDNIIRASYGPNPETGWGTVQEAAEAAVKYGRGLGVVDEEVHIAKLEGDRYVRLTEADATNLSSLPKGDYIVQVDHAYKPTLDDVPQELRKDMQFSFNLFGVNVGRALGFAGPITRYLKPARDFIDSVVSKSALVDTDKSEVISKALLKSSDSLSRKMKNLDLMEVKKLDEYFKVANRDEIPFSIDQLKLLGLSEEAIDAAVDFRAFWDAEFQLSNSAKVQELRDAGMTVIEMGDDFKMYGKEVKDTLSSPLSSARDVKVFLLGRDDFVTIPKGQSPAEELIKAGVTSSEILDFKLMKLADDVELGDDAFSYVFSKPQNIRQINKNEQVLPKRDGYYKVRYTDEYFVIETKATSVTEKADDGKAVYSAPIAGDAQKLVDKLNLEAKDGVTYRWRRNTKDTNDWRVFNDQVRSEHEEKLNTTFRGDLSKRNFDNYGGFDHIEDPLESMQSAAATLGNRIGMHDWLNNSKERFMGAYNDLLPEGQNSAFPKSHTEIGAKTKQSADPTLDRRIQEAKELWEYLDHMETYRMNSLSAKFKYSMRTLHEQLAGNPHKLSQFTSKAVKAFGDSDPVAKAKALAFEAAVVFNPTRQLTLGVADIMVKVPTMAPYAMGGMRDLSGAIAMHMAKSSDNGSDNWKKLASSLSGRSSKEMEEIYEQFSATGLLANVDKQAMLNAGLGVDTPSSIKTGVMGRSTSGVKSGYDKVRSVFYNSGFLTNEYMTQGIVWAIARKRAEVKAAKSGKKLSNRDLDDVHDFTRSYNYSQNKAGDLKYNTSDLGLFMQFAAIPHKAVLMMIPKFAGGSGTLSKNQKMALAATVVAAYGTPDEFLGFPVGKYLLDNVPSLEGLDRDSRTYIEEGFTNLLINSLVGADLATSELNPFDPNAIAEKLATLVTEPMALFTESPSGSFALPRVKKALDETVAAFQGRDFTDPDAYSSALISWLEISSGVSNITKGYMMDKYGEYRSSKGYLLDPSVTSSEAFLKAFAGLNTVESERRFDATMNRSEHIKGVKDDIKTTYQNISYSLRKVGDRERTENYKLAMRAALNAYKGTSMETVAQNTLLGIIRSDAKEQGHQSLMMSLMRDAGYFSEDEWSKLVKSFSFPREEEEKLLRVKQHIQEVDYD